jgi:hypothetical protein
MSHQVALALKDWLPFVIQCLDPFVSSEDIGKGTRWGDVLAQELNKTQYGIICVTSYNVGCPWLNFETGALSKSIDKSLVLPFLYRVNKRSCSGPLAQFQATAYDKQEIFGLVNTINDSFDEGERLKLGLLKRQFEKWWPDLDAALNQIPDNPAKETQSGISWLHTSDDLAKLMGAESGVKSVWIISPDLFKHVLSDTMRRVMETNIARGVPYRYIVPHSNLDGGISQLQHISANESELQVKEIPYDKFHSLAVTDYVILNPDNDDQHPLWVFLELPVNEPDHWIRVDDKGASGFTERFRKMWTEA